METYSIKNLTFTYPNKEEPALRNVSFDVNMGEFVVVCGQSGSGKSTLLRNLKPILAPHGNKSGSLKFYGREVDQLGDREQAAKIGYVLQNPDSQIVTDKVWHELAFGLESLSMDTKTIRLRVAEMASFFGIQTWFHKDVNHLSGGQKQLLNLASVMAMQPDVLILDEPTSQLDPIAASDFLETVKKINRELGTTVIITEHRLEDVIPMADKVIVLDEGRVIADNTPADTGAILAQKNHPMFMAMPTPLQTYSLLYQDNIGRHLVCPVDVRDGRGYLTELLKGMDLAVTSLPADEEKVPAGDPVLEMKDVWFKYERQGSDIIKDLSFKIYPGELFCIVGGNGTGKTTTLTLASGTRKPYRGTIKIKGRAIDKYKNNELFKGILGMLPQNPQSLFVEKTVMLDLLESFEGSQLTKEEKESKILDITRLVRIDHLLESHPYDLSGGEQQRAALAKVLLTDPEILFLDEPTKGLDNELKYQMAKILKDLQEKKGVTIVMVSHDVEFCGRYGDRCAMFFDGKIITTNAPRLFFSGNSFYTTAANRMSRHIFDNAVNVDDVVELVRKNMGADPPEEPSPEEPEPEEDGGTSDFEQQGDDDGSASAEPPVAMKVSEPPSEALNVHEVKARKGKKQVLLEIALAILAAVTVYVGLFAFETKQYMAVCILLVVYAMIPFFASFERRKPKAREIVILAVLIAVAVVGRAAFFMIPNFKPILAIVIISGVALGKESGFLVGAMAAFVSNFLFGQGPWTPWQMIGMALAGYLAGLIFHKYAGQIKLIPLAVFGGVTVFFMYGFIVDIWTVLVMCQSHEMTLKLIIGVYVAAFYFNLVHAAATVIFILILAKPMIEKLERVKVKYGMTVYSA